MTKPTEVSKKCHRYELVHGDDADFVAYQRHRGDGVWQTFSTWMIPRTGYLMPAPARAGLSRGTA